MKARKLQAAAQRQQQQAVTLVTKRPDSWLRQARAWGCGSEAEIELWTAANLHRIVQYHVHHRQKQTVSLREHLAKTIQVPAPPPPPLSSSGGTEVKEKLSTEAMIGKQLAGKAVNLCSKCRQLVMTETVQSRSADEGSTVSHMCQTCGGRAQLYNESADSKDDDEPEEIPPSS